MRRGTPSGLSTMSTGEPSCEVRHVLLRQDAGDDALVAVTAGHLVADLKLALDGDVDLHHLDDARRQLVALGEPIDLVAEVLLDGADVLGELRGELLELLLGLAGALLDRELRPVARRDLVERGVRRSSAPLLQRTLPLSSTSLPAVVLPTSSLRIFAKNESRDDLHLVALVGEELLLLGVLDVLGALVLLRALAREDAALMTMPCTPGGTRSELSRTSPAFSPKIARSSFSSGESWVSPFGVILPTRMSPRLDLGADAHDARLVEVLEGLLADVRDVAGDLFLAELRVAGDALELLDVDRGEDVVLGDALGDEDRVLEVVAPPGHERDEHVLAERELAHVGRRTVREDVALLDVVAARDDRLLVEASVLVRALELGQVVDVGLGRQRIALALRRRAHDDARRVDDLDDAVAARDHAHAGVAGDAALDARADERRARADERHGLALHVRAHERAVRVVVLEERDERGGDRHHLVRRHVHELDLVGRRHHRSRRCGAPR